MQPRAASQRTVAYDRITRIRIAVEIIAIAEVSVTEVASEALYVHVVNWLRGRGAIAW